jgi:hypothetical protein
MSGLLLQRREKSRWSQAGSRTITGRWRRLVRGIAVAQVCRRRLRQT